MQTARVTFVPPRVFVDDPVTLCCGKFVLHFQTLENH